MGSIRIGISGWRYAPWRGTFYPPDLPQRRELEFASHSFPTIELNGSFYALQTPQSYASWHDETPADFVFSVKGGRFITHMRRLRDVETPLANFFASGVLNLRSKLGPFLWQFPPNFRYDAARFGAFFDLLPRDMLAAQALAKRHEPWMKGRVALEVERNHRLRHCVEIRNESFVDERFVQQLREQDIAFVVADTAGKWPQFEDVTAEFVYLRLHGDKELYASGYTDAALDRWAARIDLWSRGSEAPDAVRISHRRPRRRKARDVYCYFDNDMKVKAPYDAASLMRKLGVSPPAAADPASAGAAIVAGMSSKRSLRNTASKGYRPEEGP
jgi:uncharacterized protein YecE (DUF72 family)